MKEGVARGRNRRQGRGQVTQLLSRLFIPEGKTEAVSGPVTSR